MIDADQIPSTVVSLMWRATTITRIRAIQDSSKTADWRAQVFSSVVKSQVSTWSAWMVSALYLATHRPAVSKVVWWSGSVTMLLVVLTVATFLIHTCRGSAAIRKRDLFMGAPIFLSFISASNLLIIEGILADSWLLALRMGIVESIT